MKLLPIVFVAALFSCGPASFPAETETSAEQTEASLDTKVELHFNTDWTMTLTGPVAVGAKVKVVYAGDRLNVCRGTNPNGTPAWAITGYYQFNEWPVRHFEVGGFTPTGQPRSLSLWCRRGDLSMWFNFEPVELHGYESTSREYPSRGHRTIDCRDGGPHGFRARK